MKRSWGKNSQYSTTVIYVMTIGGAVIGLLSLLGVVHILEWMGR